MKNYLVLLITLAPFLASAQLSKTVYKTIGGKTVYTINSLNVFIFTSGMAIDADGSPRAYHSDNSKALDNLGNAGKSGNWWALATDDQKKTGNPIIQSATDPAPGYYVSMTSLQDGTKKYTDPTRYVNSETIPYIAIPPKFSSDFRLGDIALVINKRNGNQCFAIFADTGPAGKIGEGSIYLAEQLGISSSPKTGGAADNVVYILIKNSGNKKVKTNQQIQQTGKTLLPESTIRLLLED